MRTILEHQVNLRVALLDEAWSDPETFVLLPDKGGVTAEWVEAQLSRVPCELHTGHFVMLTSGSTGKPKLIVGSRMRSEGLARTLHHWQDCQPVGQAILTLPLTYTYSFVNQWLWSRVVGRPLVQTAGLSRPEELGATLRQAKDAMLCLVGVQVPLLEQFFAGQAFPGVIRVHFAGGRFPQERLAVVAALFPNASVFNNYGCAEAMPRLTLRRANESPEASNIGRPLPGIELASDKHDALRFRSRFSAVGIVEESSGFTPITDETWTPTGDLGRPTPDGSWQLLGRASEVFKRYGEKISLASLLTTVLANWSGQAAFYREADLRGEEGHVLVLAPAPEDAQVRSLLRALAATHPRTHWPIRVESLDTLPTLSSGKVDSIALRSVPDKRSHWHQRI